MSGMGKIIPFPGAVSRVAVSGPVVRIGGRPFRIRTNSRLAWLWQWVLEEFAEFQ